MRIALRQLRRTGAIPGQWSTIRAFASSSSSAKYAIGSQQVERATQVHYTPPARQAPYRTASPALFDETRKPSPHFLQNQLLHLLRAPSSSTPAPDHVRDAKILSIALMILPQRRRTEVFATYGHLISNALVRLDLGHPQVREQIPQILQVLEECWYATTPRSSRAGTRRGTDGYGVAVDISRFIVNAITGITHIGRNQAGAELSGLLKGLERGMERWAEISKGWPLPLPIAAAWIVLRVQAQAYATSPGEQGIESNLGGSGSGSGSGIELDLPWKLPEERLVANYLQTSLFQSTGEEELPLGQIGIAGDDAERTATYLDEIKRLCENTRSGTIELLGIRRTLRELIELGDEEALRTFWTETKGQIQRSIREETWVEDQRTKAYEAFISAFLRSQWTQRAVSFEVEVEEILRMVPKPTPLPIIHTLLAHRGDLDSSAHLTSAAGIILSSDRMDSAALRSLDASDSLALDGSAAIATATNDTLRERGIASLHATWQTISQQGGVKDLRAYMIYMDGLGRLGDLPGLQSAWNELIEDKACRELYFATEAAASEAAALGANADSGVAGSSQLSGEESGSMDTRTSNRLKVTTAHGTITTHAFPPIQALNQMLSSCLLISRDGPPIALDLFHQAVQPDSTIPVNLITINILLRHHARRADIPAMNSIFTLAAELGPRPDIITYTTLLQGLFRANRLDLAKETLATMEKQGLKANERTCSLLISDLAKEGGREGLIRAEEMLGEMKSRKMHIGEATWTGLISGYFRGGWEQDAWDAVRRMESSGVKLGRVGYNMVLRQVGERPPPPAGANQAQGVRSQSWALRLLKQMLASGVRPNSDTFTIILGPIVKSRNWEEGEVVLYEMQAQGFRPEKGVLQRLVDAVKARRRPPTRRGPRKG